MAHSNNLSYHVTNMVSLIILVLNLFFIAQIAYDGHGNSLHENAPHYHFGISAENPGWNLFI